MRKAILALCLLSSLAQAQRFSVILVDTVYRRTGTYIVLNDSTWIRDGFLLLGDGDNSIVGKIKFYDESGFLGQLSPTTPLSGDKTWLLPDTSGTLALTTSVAGLGGWTYNVPNIYSATANSLVHIRSAASDTAGTYLLNVRSASLDTLAPKTASTIYVSGIIAPVTASTYSLGTEALPWLASESRAVYGDTIRAQSRSLGDIRMIAKNTSDTLSMRMTLQNNGIFVFGINTTSTANLTTVDTAAFKAFLDVTSMTGSGTSLMRRQQVRGKQASASDVVFQMYADTMYDASQTLSAVAMPVDILYLGPSIGLSLTRSDTAIGMIVNYPQLQLSGDADINGGLLTVDTTNTTIIHAEKIRPVTSGSTTVDFDSSLSMSIGAQNSYSGLLGAYILGQGNTISANSDNSSIIGGYVSTISGSGEKNFILGGYDVLSLDNSTGSNSYSWLSGAGIRSRQGNNWVWGLTTNSDTVNLSHKHVVRNVSSVISSAADTNAYGFQGLYIHWPYAKDSASYYIYSKRGNGVGRNVVNSDFRIGRQKFTTVDSTLWSPTGVMDFLVFDSLGVLHFNYADSDPAQAFGTVKVDTGNFNIQQGSLETGGVARITSSGAISGTTGTFSGDVAVNGGDLTTSSATLNAFTSASSLTAMNYGSTGAATIHTFNSNTSPSVYVYRNTNTATASQALSFRANNAASAAVEYARVAGQIVTNTTGLQSGNLLFYHVKSGTITNSWMIDTVGTLKPLTANTYDVGTSALPIRVGYVDTVIADRYVALSTGSAPIAGNATLVAGTVTVNTTAATANCIVMLTRKTSGGTIGTAITYTISAGTSFTITSDSVLDTSTFSWFIVRMY